jgi:ABC-type transporter Mla MlaB component
MVATDLKRLLQARAAALALLMDNMRHQQACGA